MNMQNSTLPLFTTNEPNLNVSTWNKKMSEEKIVTPLIEVLGSAIPQTQNGNSHVLSSINEALEELFPEQQYDEKNIQTAQQILGSIVTDFTADGLKYVVSEVQYLVETYLDDFERSIFNGLTLQEVLHEKGRA